MLFWPYTKSRTNHRMLFSMSSNHYVLWSYLAHAYEPLHTNLDSLSAFDEITDAIICSPSSFRIHPVSPVEFPLASLRLHHNSLPEELWQVR